MKTKKRPAPPPGVKSDANIRRTLKALRKIVDTTKDPMEKRVAYIVETAIRWATEKTSGWNRPENEVADDCTMLRKGL